MVPLAGAAASAALAPSLVQALRAACPAAEGKPVAVIESVNVMGGKNNAIQTQGSLLRTLGAIETVLECLGWAPQYANPQTWKRFYGLIDAELTDAQRKKKALECARRLYGVADIPLAKHHNRAESILIGHWWMRKRA